MKMTTIYIFYGIAFFFYVSIKVNIKWLFLFINAGKTRISQI